jgi:deoxyribodipyrimidine photo-lyase
MDSFGIPSFLQQFEPTREAALARLARVSPARYSRTRNHLDGAVTGLSPYITHGLLTPKEALATLAQKHALGFSDKLVQEFAWREFFHHVWAREGDAILQDLGKPVWAGAYAQQLPQDIREARTGVPAIDAAVRVLYATGYLHNHARLWLASYCVHLRKVHWRAGADWMYGHLLDGDLASNHLSWQWVAGTFAHKPYVFNADNVTRYAPATATAAWGSADSAIDLSYEALDEMARNDTQLTPLRTAAFGAQEPALLSQPPQANPLRTALRFDAAALDGRSVRLVHPWHTHIDIPLIALNIQARSNISSKEYKLGILHTPFHQSYPWSAQRWQFVAAKLQAQCDALFIGDVRELRNALAQAAQVHSQATLNPHYASLLQTLAQVDAAPSWLPPVAHACASFSKYYERVQKATSGLNDCLV